jgi:hypothetical protein
MKQKRKNISLLCLIFLLFVPTILLFGSYNFSKNISFGKTNSVSINVLDHNFGIIDKKPTNRDQVLSLLNAYSETNNDFKNNFYPNQIEISGGDGSITNSGCTLKPKANSTFYTLDTTIAIK